MTKFLDNLNLVLFKTNQMFNNTQDNYIVIDDGIQSVRKELFWELQKTSFQIQYQKGYMKYIKDGIILNIEKHQLIEGQFSFNKNLNQIKHLTWLGQINNNNMKVGRWNALWRGEQLGVGGNYDQYGQKIGLWVEAFDNFWDQSQVTYTGLYKNGLKYGQWDIKYKEQKIGGGNYTDKGYKDGGWIDLHQYYNFNNQVIFEGRYQNGKKIGYWEFMYREKIIEEFQFIGFQNYNVNGIKIGKSVELIKDQLNFSSIVTIGEYINGQKEGKWDIKERDKLMYTCVEKKSSF